MKNRVAFCALLVLLSGLAFSQTRDLFQELADAISVGIARVPAKDDAPKITDWIQSVGSIVAVLIAIAVAWYQNWHTRRLSEAKERAEIRSFVQAIRTEIVATWQNYSRFVRSDLLSLEEGGYLDSTYLFSENAFSIYENAGVQVGKIQDVALQARIVTTYAIAKSLILSFELHNKLLEALQPIPERPSRQFVVQQKLVLRNLTSCDARLKQIDSILEQSVLELLGRLDAFLA